MDDLAQKMRAALRHHAARMHVGDETCAECAPEVIDAATESACVELDTAKVVSDQAVRTLQLFEEERLKAKVAKDTAYSERNRCVALLARMALALGLRVGVGEHPSDSGWEADWRTILFIDLPTGQVCWHFHDSERHLLAGIPPYTGSWDGHTTEEKYERAGRAFSWDDAAKKAGGRARHPVVAALLLAIGLTFGSAAHAGVDRAVIENGTTTGAVTPATHPTLIWGQSTGATLVAITCAADSCTRAAPSGATEGMRLDSVGAYRVEACLTAGTFAGGGAIKLYPYNQNTSTWSYLVGGDLSLSDANGLAGCVSWLTSANSFRATEWRLVARPVGVTTSGGGQLSVKLFACLKGGCAP